MLDDMVKEAKERKTGRPAESKTYSGEK